MPIKKIPRTALFMVALIPEHHEEDYLDTLEKQVAREGIGHIGLNTREITSAEIVKMQNFEHRYAILASHSKAPGEPIRAKTFSLTAAGINRPLSHREDVFRRYKTWLKLGPAPQAPIEDLVIRGTDEKVIGSLKPGNRQLHFCCFAKHSKKIFKHFSTPDLPKFSEGFPPGDAAWLNAKMKKAKKRLAAEERERRARLKPSASSQPKKVNKAEDSASSEKPKRGLSDILFED